LLIKTSKPECVWKTKSTLGEGTLWVKKLNSLFFVDIKKKKILILNLKTNKKKNQQLFFLKLLEEMVLMVVILFNKPRMVGISLQEIHGLLVKVTKMFG